MYKFKYKAQNEISQTFYFKTMQEVFGEICKICESNKIEDILKVQKEYNIRFYVTKVNK